ncbi:MAG: hypothetical protein CW691_00555 [Candidatus Bathyarchaeum sp.]|nr:MAG: hypothetical protein CW691_00555 [Candidatus Bathyarchaeum sp.]
MSKSNMNNDLIAWFMVLSLVVVALMPVAYCLEPSTLDEIPDGVHILEDGSVTPYDAPVRRDGNVYTLTGDVTYSITVEKDNITIDGAGYTLQGNVGQYHGRVQMQYRRGVTVRNLVVKDTYRAFDLTFADDNTLTGNTIINSGRAIYFWFSWRNNVTGNTITNAGYAFDFFLSPNHWSQQNVVANNTVLNSGIGINLMESNNTFLDNVINSSSLGVSVSGHQNLFRNNKINCTGVSVDVSSFENDIDDTNLVNGKPIIQWIGHRNEAVPSEAGYVLLSGCENITVQGLDADGMRMFSTTGSLIAGNTFSVGKYGIQMIESSQNTVSGNMLLNNNYGLELGNCEGNKIVGNSISNNSEYGILLSSSHYNTIKQNNVANNGFEANNLEGFGVKLLHSSNNRFTENNVTRNKWWGIRVLGDQHDNVIYHNNFIDNMVVGGLQVSMTGPANPSIWDNGTVGNYWSDYLSRYPNATELDETGVGDTPFHINPNNIDHYPLMKPYIIPEFASWILLPLFVVATLFALIAKKKLFQQHS